MKDQSAQVKEKISIHIDGKHYFAPEEEMTGAELKALANIDSTKNLWREVPGQEDLLIEDNTKVQLKPGDHFMTSLKRLNPGSK